MANLCAFTGDIVRVHNLSKFKKEFRGATGIVLKWHHDNIYSVLVNTVPVTLSHHEFDVTHRN